MKTRLYTSVIVFLLIASTSVLCGQNRKVTFEAKVPDFVEPGSAFQVVFEINNDVDYFEGPDLNGFEVLGGPGYSKSSVMKIAGGRRMSEVKVTYTYALMAPKSGNYEIGSALIRIGRNTYKSKPVTIKVGSAFAGKYSNEESEGEGGGDLFILSIVSSRSPYKGEVVLFTQKLYTRLAINNIGRVRLPSFSGFWTENLEIGNYEIVQEQYKGKLYNTLILSRTLLIPQRTGRMVIEPSSVMIQRVVERTVNRQIFGGVIQQRLRELTDNEIKSSNLVLDVKELPVNGKPLSFSGTVGNFTIESNISTERIEVGEPIELNIRISGSGNIKLIDNPKVVLPSQMDLFEPEITGKTNNTVTGMSGYRNYLYIIIPRDTGFFTIPEILFSFFNPETGKYSELRTDELDLKVVYNAEGQHFRTANIGKEDVKYFGRDIRFLSLNYKTPIFKWLTPGSLVHLVAILLSILILMLWLWRYRKRVKMYANKEKIRFIKAEQSARQKIKEAASAMKDNDESRFYEVLLDALWGYAADKLNIMPSELSKNKVRDELAVKGVNQDIINRFISLIEDSEFYRYAPVDKSMRMEKCYQDANNYITEIHSKFNSKLLQ